jgi:D-alanyl-D-alanine carboxypeptidase/D-alanyl-D-alanine-endopeptidase (penicillin-binding protein 4)
LLPLLLLAGLCLGPGPEQVVADEIETLSAIFDRPTLAQARVGVMVADLRSGEVLFTRNAARPLILASNTKLFTTAAALARLGSGHRIETVLYRRGRLDGDVLHGDLVLVGGGDPTMGDRFYGDAAGPLDRIARAVAAAGVRSVTGDLVLDERLFDRVHQHPGWPRDQLDRWYAAPVCALSLNDGCIDVSVYPGTAVGAPARVVLAPNPPTLTIEPKCTTTSVRSEHVVSIGRLPGRNVYVVRGAILAGAAPVTTSIAQWEPALILGAVLRERLHALDIELRGSVRLAGEADPPAARDARPLTIVSTLLAEILPVINKRSQNHYAEMTLKRLGAVVGRGGTFRAGADIVEAWAREAGVAKDEVDLEDGSGLSRGNRASPRAVVQLLRGMAAHSEADVFLSSLAVMGRDGTLRKRLRQTGDAERVRAKTGTIRAVSSLSGYVLPSSPEGRFLAFSFLSNRVEVGAARRAQDDAIKVLLGWR